MTLETFFEKFDQFAEAPNAVAKMRELILHLAAHGRLVEQSPDDEPAAILRTRIERHFEALRGRRELRGARLESLSHDGLPELPSNWEWVRLGNVADYGSLGKAESLSIPEHAWLLDLEDIEKNSSRLLRRKTFRDSPSKSTKTAFIVGDVLFGKLRPYLNKVIVADAAGYCTTEIVPIRTFGFIDPWYLCYSLRRPDFVAYANSKSYGMNLPRLGTEDARRAPFPLPPLAEQKRIVAKVDELMALCDQLEAQQQEREAHHAELARASLARFADAPTPANLDLLFHQSYTIAPADMRKTILTLAVQGKLVPQDHRDETADDCLARLGLESTVEELNGVNSSEYLIPPAWTRVRFDDVAVVAGGVTLGRKLGDQKTVTLPYLRVANVKRGEINLGVIKEVSIPEDEIERYSLQANDLLMTEGGDWDKVGRAAIWRSEIPVCLHQNHIFRARMRSTEITPDWFEFFFNSPAGRSYFESAAKQTTNLASINMRQVRGCPVPFPPLAEQRRIVAKVDQLMALVDQLEAQLATARSKATELMEAAVGELTGHEALTPSGLQLPTDLNPTE